MNFFGIGLPEMAVIAAIGLLVFGPKRLPELGKTLGKTLRGFQSASQEFEKEFRQAVTPEPESSSAQAAVPVASMSSPSLLGSNEIAAVPVSAAATDPAAQPSSLSPAPSQAIAIGAVPTLVSAPASEPAAATIPAPVAGDAPGS
jgi:sec-independent protein translocase protein TatA